MANIFYQALRKLKPFEEKKDGLLSVDFTPLRNKEKFFIGRIKIDFPDATQYKSQFIIKIHQHEARILKRFCEDLLKEIKKGVKG